VALNDTSRRFHKGAFGRARTICLIGTTACNILINLMSHSGECVYSQAPCQLIAQPCMHSRMEQIPEGRSLEEVEAEIDSKCCVCHRKWTIYRGQHGCASKFCGVPVIVCTSCTTQANANPKALQCDLCREDYRLPKVQLDLSSMKRKAEERMLSAAVAVAATTQNSSPSTKKAKHDREQYLDRIFLSRLPLTATVSKIRQALMPPETPSFTGRKKKQGDTAIRIHWLTDQQSGAFYGSCMVQMPSDSWAKQVIARVNDTGIRMPGQKTKIRASYVWKRDQSRTTTPIEDPFSSRNYQAREYPPIGDKSIKC
jgi:hypothetical protein